MGDLKNASPKSISSQLGPLLSHHCLLHCKQPWAQIDGTPTTASRASASSCPRSFVGPGSEHTCGTGYPQEGACGYDLCRLCKQAWAVWAENSIVLTPMLSRRALGGPILLVLQIPPWWRVHNQKMPEWVLWNIGPKYWVVPSVILYHNEAYQRTGLWG